MHQGNARAQCKEQAHPRPMRFDQNDKVALCKIQVVEIEDVTFKSVEGKIFEIPSAMQNGKTQGMVTLNNALFDLIQKDIVEPRDAYLKAVEKVGFEAMLTEGGYKI